jgi:hypothetical protein
VPLLLPTDCALWEDDADALEAEATVEDAVDALARLLEEPPDDESEPPVAAPPLPVDAATDAIELPWSAPPEEEPGIAMHTLSTHSKPAPQWPSAQLRWQAPWWHA